jgi:type VI secretion system protein VasD
MNRSFLIALLAMTLSCCAMFGNKDEKKPIHSQITYSLFATKSVNPNASGEATPLEVQVFELEDDSMFLSAGFDQLIENAKKNLKSNYISHRDYVLVPGQFKFVDPFEVNKKTAYIGVMARFANPNRSDWKKVVRVLPTDKQYHLLIYLNDQSVQLDQVE